MSIEKHPKLLPEFKVQEELESKMKNNYSKMLLAMNKNILLDYLQQSNIEEESNDK